MAHPDIPTDRWRARLEQALDRLREEAHTQDEGPDAEQWVPGEMAAHVVQEEGRAARLVIEIPIEALKQRGTAALVADNDVSSAAPSTFWDVEDALAKRYERLRRLECADPRDEARLDALQREIGALEAQQISLLDATLAAHRAVLPEGERVRDVLARHGIDLPESLHSAR